MLHGEIGVTGTSDGGVRGLPATSESDGISEGTLVKGEAEFLQRKRGEPTGGTFLLC